MHLCHSLLCKHVFFFLLIQNSFKFFNIPDIVAIDNACIRNTKNMENVRTSGSILWNYSNLQSGNLESVISIHLTSIVCFYKALGNLPIFPIELASGEVKPIDYTGSIVQYIAWDRKRWNRKGRFIWNYFNICADNSLVHHCWHASTLIAWMINILRTA